MRLFFALLVALALIFGVQGSIDANLGCNFDIMSNEEKSKQTLGHIVIHLYEQYPEEFQEKLEESWHSLKEATATKDASSLGVGEIAPMLFNLSNLESFGRNVSRMHLFLVDVVNDGLFRFDPSLPLSQLELIEDNYLSYYALCQVGQAMSILPYVGSRMQQSLCLCADGGSPKPGGSHCVRQLNEMEKTERIVQVDPLRKTCVYSLAELTSSDRSSQASKITYGTDTPVLDLSQLLSPYAADMLETDPHYLVPGFLPKYPLTMTLGILLFVFVLTLCEYRLFHYLLAASFGAFLAFVAIFIVIFRTTSSMMESIPGAQIILPGSSLAVLLGVFVNGSSLQSVIHTMASLTFNVWIHGIAGYTQVGKVFVLLSSLLSVFFVYYYQLFQHPASLSSLSLKTVVRILGAFFVLNGSPNLDINLAILSWLLLRDYWQDLLRSVFFLLYSSPSIEKSLPGGSYMDDASYDRVGDETTRRELLRLRQYMNKHPEELKWVNGGGGKGRKRILKFLRGEYDGKAVDERKHDNSFCLIL